MAWQCPEKTNAANSVEEDGKDVRAICMTNDSAIPPPGDTACVFTDSQATSDLIGNGPTADSTLSDVGSATHPAASTAHASMRFVQISADEVLLELRYYNTR